MHVIRMSYYTKFLAEKINANNNWIEFLCNAAPMQDIGKIGIADNMLLKPDKLTDKEWFKCSAMLSMALKFSVIMTRHCCLWLSKFVYTIMKNLMAVATHTNLRVKISR